jgi:hypothetical protein
MREIVFNINHTVKVKLTDKGRQLLRKKHELFKGYAGFKDAFKLPEEDEFGYSKWQLWELMSDLGNETYMGGSLPFETEIIICHD